LVVEKQTEQLKGFLQKASREATPEHFPRRKRELSQQVRELAELATEAEAGEDVRKQRSRMDVERIRGIIEEVRYEDVVSLQEELARLSRKREVLFEQQLRIPANLNSP
jgi:hypothetical protein